MLALLRRPLRIHHFVKQLNAFDGLLDYSVGGDLVKFCFDKIEAVENQMLQEGYTRAEIDKIDDKARVVARQKITARGGRAMGAKA